MLTLKNIIGGKKKRLNGVITTEEAKEAFDKYYSTQKTYLGKVFDMMYQKEGDAVLNTCDKPEFVKCRKKKPNKDGKGNTCLDIAEKVCPKESFGSAKYTGTKKGPQRFDIYGVDAFPEGEKFKVIDNNGDEKEFKSKGLPKAKDGTTNKKIAKKQYKKRQDKGEEHIVKKRWKDYKKKGVNSCKSYRKNKSPKCETIDGCVWVSAMGCRKRKNKEEIREERKEKILEISDDEDDEEDDDRLDCDEVVLSYDYKQLKGIKKLPKYEDKKYYVKYEDEKDDIVVYLCDKYDKIKYIGILMINVEGIDKSMYQSLFDDDTNSKGSEKLNEYIEDLKDKNLIEFIPKPQSGGGNIRLQFNIDTSNGNLLNDNDIIGVFKNSSLTIF